MNRNNKGQFLKGQPAYNKKVWIKKNCLCCKKEFSVKPSLMRVACCSRSCASKIRVHSKQSRLKASRNNIGKHSGPRPTVRGENNYKWKGDKVSCGTLHHWVRRYLGRATMCENCGISKKCKDGRSYVQWANISRAYKRTLEDWKQLCYLCHKAFDGYGNRKVNI